MPTTREPACGPEPSDACCSTVPAKSQPGLQPASAFETVRTSPRLSEMALTRTSASDGEGVGEATSRMTRRSGVDGSTIMAWMVVMDGGYYAKCGLCER